MSLFGKRLSKFRKFLELSQKEFADRLNVHQVTIARYETNKIKPTSEFMERLVDVFYHYFPLYLWCDHIIHNDGHI